MTVLADKELDALARTGAVEPYDPSLLQPASIDCRLGMTFRRVRAGRHLFVDLADVPLDLTEKVCVGDDGSFRLDPGAFVLGRTMEFIRVPTNMVARMEGKSSVGSDSLCTLPLGSSTRALKATAHASSSTCYRCRFSCARGFPSANSLFTCSQDTPHRTQAATPMAMTLRLPATGTM